MMTRFGLLLSLAPLLPLGACTSAEDRADRADEVTRPGIVRRLARALGWVTPSTIMIVSLLAFFFAKPGQAEEGLALVPDALPNYVGLGVGVANDYVGADELAPGGLPLARLSWERRYVTLQGNYLAANLINHPMFRLGPAGLYRFGRDDVDDNAVDDLSSIDDAVELGGFAGLEFVAEDDPRKRISLNIDFLHDVTDSHDGYLVSASARAWYPLARATEFGVSVATTYGNEDYMSTYFSIDSEGAAQSGLDTYDADDGLRDARVTVMVIQSLSEHWHVGAGVIYSRLLSEAADSPIVDDRGSPNQVVAGVGFVYSW